jgi:hypothetical protein
MLAAMLLCVSTAWSDEAGRKIFRYKDANGIQVTTYVLPPEAAGNGYDILNSKGDVLEVVKPAPTEAEKPAALAAIEQEKFDKNLLLQYGSLTELLQAQKRKLDELDSKMAVLQGNFSSIRSQIDTEQMKAANFERQGRPVPEESLKTLADLYANYEQTETAMHEREKETNDEKKQYQYELERYKAVKGLK